MKIRAAHNNTEAGNPGTFHAEASLAQTGAARASKAVTSAAEAPSLAAPTNLTLPPSIPTPSQAPRRPINPHLPTVADTIRSLLSMVVVALFILTFLVQPFRIPSESMERTLLVGDFLLVNKQLYAPSSPLPALRELLPYREPQHGDVVVFRFPLDPEDYVVKRVIGLPGDRIHLAHGTVFRNGAPLREPYAVFEPAYGDNYRDNFPLGPYTDPGVDTHWWNSMRGSVQGGDIVVPPGNYFVMGDNRNHSRDSRYWGFVPRSAILGRPFVVYFSLREPSATDMPTLPDDKLGTENDPMNPLNGMVDFARWDRMFRIVR